MFDALWDLDMEGVDEELPPALGVPPAARETLEPPMPAPEYVETMMQLGELDDPSDPLEDLRRRAGAAGEPASPARPGEGIAAMGLVMASERELLLPTEVPSSGAGPATLPEAAVANVRARKGAGLRAPAPARGAPVIGGVAPRAPSIPPPPPSSSKDPESLDPDALTELPFEGVGGVYRPGASRRPVSTSGSQGGLRLARSSLPTSPPPPSVRATRRPSVEPSRLATPPPPPPAPSSFEDWGALVDEEPPPASALDHLREMQERFDARNYTGALVLAESVLTGNPNHAVARRTAESCREMLTQKYLSSLGGTDRIPRVAVTPEEVRRLSLDHRAGFLLSFVDGVTSLGDVLDASSMPELDALRILFDLRQQCVIDMVEPVRRPTRSGKR